MPPLPVAHPPQDVCRYLLVQVRVRLINHDMQQVEPAWTGRQNSQGMGRQQSPAPAAGACPTEAHTAQARAAGPAGAGRPGRFTATKWLGAAPHCT